MELYLVKSSGTDEWGSEYWENLQVFEDLKLARKYVAKLKKLIRSDGSDDKVEIENFTLRTEEI
jgi:hypothetical protein